MVLEPNDYQLDSFEKLEFYPKAFQYLGKIAAELDFELVMVTNQDGLGTDSHPEANFWPVHHLVMTQLGHTGAGKVTKVAETVDSTAAAGAANSFTLLKQT